MARAPKELTVDDIPESDRIDEFPHPRHTEAFYGNALAEAQLAAGLASRKLHHAWLLVGPNGVGKATLAYRFARAALSGSNGEGVLFDDLPDKLKVDPESKASHLVRALSHPDLLVLRRPYDIKLKRFKTVVTVDEVRRLRDFLGHKQTGDGWKVVIVDSADDLNVSAANALLKPLEEPPAGVVFLLIASMPGRVLTTIRSRCRQLTMLPLEHGALRSAAEQVLLQCNKSLPDDAQWPHLLQTADGSVSKLLHLASDDGMALSKKVDQVFGNLVRTDWPGIHQLTDEFAAVSAAEKFDWFVDLLLARLGRTVRASATGSGEPVDLETARKMGVDADLASWAQLWETLVREKATLSALNLDRKAYVLDCVMRLSRLAIRG